MNMRLLLGAQSVREAIRAHGANMHEILIEARPGDTAAAVARFATDQGCKVTEVTRSDLDRLSKGVRHQGVGAWAPALTLSLFDPEELGPTALVLALDELEDPQNFGAIIRSAVAFSADRVIFPEHHSAPLSPSTFRASAGAIEHAKLCKVQNLRDTIEDAKRADFTVIGLDGNAKESLSEIPRTDRMMLVVGAEGKGLRKGVKAACTALGSLPMSGRIDSLNASVAAAIALYELRRPQ
jgi:23S rRNA (guanosine2251-2'-O)-methyltransferase